MNFNTNFTSKLISYFCLAMSMIFAGSSVVVSKLMVKSLPIFLSSGLSLFIALTVLIPFCIFSKVIQPLKRKEILILFFQGLSGTFLFRIFLFLGVNGLSGESAGIITGSSPVVVSLLAVIILKERFSLNKLVGVVLAVLGIININLMTSGSSGSDSFIGFLFVSLTVLCESTFSILSKFLDNRLNPIYKTTLVSFFAFICFIPLSLYDLFHYDIRNITSFQLIYLIYYGLFVTVIAFIFWFRGIRDTEASKAAVFTGFMPISAVLLSVFVLKENLTSSHILSLLLIAFGLLITLKPDIFTRLLFWKRPLQSVNDL